MFRFPSTQLGAKRAGAFLHRAFIPRSSSAARDSIVGVTSRHESSYVRDPKYATVTPADVAAFKDIVGADYVLQNADDIEPYRQDWMRKWSGTPPVVLRPRTTAEVSSLLRYCNDKGIAVVPQGGNTGLVGGSVPLFDEVILSLSRMDSIISLDDIQGIVTAEAGVILERLTGYLEEHGYTAPLDLGAKGSCQIGGNVATHAGGLRFVRYGSLRGTVLGLEAVLADGRIIDVLTTLRKDNTGYDLKQLFIGSEGTLGVVTKVALLCPPKPRAVDVIYLGLPSYEHVISVMRLARYHLQETISATEFQDATSLRLVHKHLKARSPVDGPVDAAAAAAGENGGNVKFPFYMLIEASGGSSKHNREKIDDFLADVFEKYGEEGVDGAIAESEAQAKGIWKLREGVPEAASKEGYVYKYDVSLPVGQMYDLVERVRTRLAGSGATVMGYGHLGDGNLHINIVAPKHSQELLDLIEPWLFGELRAVRGSVSAEHGLGQAKGRYMLYSKTPESVSLMEELKSVLDPKGTLNPYKVLSPGSNYDDPAVAE